jgi:Tol biopolymer transport system component
MAVKYLRRIRAGWRLCLLCFLLAQTCAGGTSGQVGGLAASPDSKVILVMYQKRDTSFIYTVSVDTGEAIRLTNAKTGWESSPSFSPDGKRIAYAYYPDNAARSRIVIVSADASDAHEWSPSGVADFSPVLSPDNKTVVFSRAGFYGSYSPIAQPHPHAWDFYASDLDGTNLRQVTSESFYMASAASVSPDGKSMVVVTEGLYTNRQIAVYSLDAPGQPTLARRPHVPKEADHKNPILNCPNYMPDGKSVIFMAASNGKHGYDYDIYRVNLETNALERLTIENGYATHLNVSADGKTAVFLKWRKNWLGDLTGNEVYLLDVESQKLTPLKISGLD